jgi:hypothetical protein
MNNKLFFFDTMITPKIITFIYWILLLAVVGYGLSTMFGGYAGFTFQKFLMGLLYIAGGAVVVRIWCELMIVIFKINENLQNLNNPKN